MSRAVVLSLLVLGCSHQHPASGLPDAAAALVEHVPADTPYAFAALEPLPRAYLERTLARGRKSLHEAVARIAELGATGPGVRIFTALAQELEPSFSIEGMTRIGIGPSPRSVFYGIGLVPAARVQIADGKAVAAFVDRVMARGGGPAGRADAHGRRWDIAVGRGTVVVAVTDRELLATFAPTALLGPVLARLYGDAHDGPSLAEAPTLPAIAQGYRFEPTFIGFVDLVRVAAAFTDARQALDRKLLVELGLPDPPLPPVCAGEIAGLTARAPRVVFGLDEITTTRTRARFIVELDATLAGELMALRLATPGVGAPLGPAIASFGAALDLPKGIDFLRRHARAVLAAPHRCGGLADLNLAAAAIDRELGTPLPAPLDDIRGFAAVLDAYESGTVPKVRAEAVISATDPIRLMSFAKRYASFMPGLSVLPNGKPVAVPLGPLTGFVAIQGRLLGLAIGEGSDLALVRLMSDRPAPGAPVFAMAYDADKLERVLADVGALFGDGKGAPLGLHGKVEIVAELGDRGVIVRIIQEEP